MNILLVSECDKRALTETRRILDQFAERRGERTWQTPMTQAGLDTLRKLLRRTARKNTAVACHWIRGLDHSELLWIVGDARRFNTEGAVPTNTTARNILRREDENDWHTAEDIRLLAQLAALLHDLGKSSIAFQERLRGERHEKNLYRHEWVSLRLFQAFVGTDDDARWLQRLADATFDEQTWIAKGRYIQDGIDENPPHPFTALPPLAAAVGWLILTHHRLPVVPAYHESNGQKRLGTRTQGFEWSWLETPLALVEHNWNEIKIQAARKDIAPYWKPAGVLPVIQPIWKIQAVKLARRLLGLHARRTSNWLDNPYLMHLARLSLMLADHYYSALPRNSSQRVQAEKNDALFANTDSSGPKQALGEHILGVARDAGLIAHALPAFERHLPRLTRHRGLRKRSADPRFSWQDKAADATTVMRETAREHGAFIVNMASTGCGKTLANARILYALANPEQGMRATYALGLRTLTLQTGRSYRRDLHLDKDDLAIMVGGSASRALFEYYQARAENTGSSSIQALLEEDSHVRYEGHTSHHPLLARALHDPNIAKLLSAPMLVCTIDHITPATEALRAGRQIAPMLRLMSSDLILDELDDYDLNDLPALTRLVHWAGMLGTRVVLSSATLPPALVEGMYSAWRAGRMQYRRNRGNPGGQDTEHIQVPCLWADEFGVHNALCSDADRFNTEHMQFVSKRASRLKQEKPLRRAELVPLEIGKGLKTDILHVQFAQHVRDACLRLHHDHAQTDAVSGKRVSFGIVRMANIDSLFDVAQALFTLGAPDNTHIHLCVYHARFPLLQRSAIEHLLDGTFNRHGDAGTIYQYPDIRAALDANSEQHHLFIVLASPVCEVGRDWDADWALAEPSSMRALIQLAGRVQRHRAQYGDKPNLLVFNRNVKSLAGKKLTDGDPAPVFVRPGFEYQDDSLRFRLRSSRLDKLLSHDEYRILTALPRICPRPMSQWRSRERLVDLEQARIAASMLPRDRLPTALATPGDAPMQRDEATWSWRYPQAALTGVLPQQQPFRERTLPEVTLVFLPDDDGERLLLHRIEDTPGQHGQTAYVCVNREQRHDVKLAFGERISAWGRFDLMALLAEQAEHLDLPLHACAERLATVEVTDARRGWRYHPLLGFAKGK